MPAVTWFGRIHAYCLHDDPAAETANVVALVVGWNGPFYPLYLLALAGPHAAATLTLLATPLFLSLPLLSRRSSLAGRFGLVLVGTANTLWCMKVLGPGTGVDLFLLPCIALAALLFRRREQGVMLVAGVLPLAVYCIPTAVTGAALMPLDRLAAARLYSLNAASVLLLTAVLAMQFARLLRRIASAEEPG